MGDNPDHNIVVDGLTKRYGDVDALRGIDFEVDAGEIVGFVGPNGAGKTTTMKILSCTAEATDGTAVVAGHDVHDDPDAVRRHIGVLPEDVPLYDEMLVYDLLKFVGRMHDCPGAELKDRIDEVARMTGLIPVIERPIRELSKGFRQRVGLAQAIIHRPPVLILDEPTTGLDPNQIIEIRDVITAIGRDNTVLLSTHILQEVSAVCDRLVVLDDGRIVADGTIDELRDQLTDSTPGLVVEYKHRDRRQARQLLENLDAVDRLLELGSSSERAVFRLVGNPDALRESLFGLGADAPTTIRPATPDLEEIFRQLTTGVGPVDVTADDSDDGIDITSWMNTSADNSESSTSSTDSSGDRRETTTVD